MTLCVRPSGVSDTFWVIWRPFSNISIVVLVFRDTSGLFGFVSSVFWVFSWCFGARFRGSESFVQCFWYWLRVSAALPGRFRCVSVVFWLSRGAFRHVFWIVWVFFVHFKHWLVFHGPSGSVWLYFLLFWVFIVRSRARFVFFESFFDLGHDVWSVPGAGSVAWLHPGPTWRGRRYRVGSGLEGKQDKGATGASDLPVGCGYSTWLVRFMAPPGRNRSLCT